MLDEEVSTNTQDYNYNNGYYNDYSNDNDNNDNNGYNNDNDNYDDNYNDYNNDNDDNYNGYNNYANTVDQDVTMVDLTRDDTYNSDYDSSENIQHRHKIQSDIDTTKNQEKNMVSLHPKINNR